jgi:creatinine amidohydrolase
VNDLAAMSWEEVQNLDRSHCIAILPVGAVEAHGPHLPLNTDVVIASAMAVAGGKRLAARGHPPVLLPPLTYTAAGYAAGFPGTLSVDPEIVTRLVVDIARGLARQGFPLLAVANAHLDPAHLAALERAGGEIRKEGLIRFVFPNLAARPWAPRLTEEFRTGACHAGQFETSIILAVDPGLVRGEIAVALPANPASVSRAIQEGKRTFEEAGGPRAYFGDPARATREEGDRTIAILGAILEEAVLGTLSPADVRASR